MAPKFQSIVKSDVHIQRGRPRSSEPAFWEVWTKASVCNLDWEAFAAECTRDRVPASTTKRDEPATNAPATPEET